MIGGWSFVLGKPAVCGYDTSALFREDCLERIKYLQAEENASMKEMEQLKRKHAATEEQTERMKKEIGVH